MKLHSKQTPLLVAGIYLIVSAIYIVVSTYLVADVVEAPLVARNIELAKGLLFVTCSAALIYGVCHLTLSRLRARRRHNQALRDDMIRAERQATTGLLAASIAHDARNELTLLKTDNDILQRRTELDDTQLELIEEQRDAIERLIGLMSRLRSAGCSEVDAPEDVDIAAHTRQVIKSLRGHSQLQDCRLKLNSDADDTTLSVYPTMLHQILINLLFNAGEACRENGEIEVRLQSVDDAVAIEVHDNGPGIPPERRQQVVHAFESSKENGSGLGLFSVQTCARSHGGHLDIQTSPLGGACIRVLLRGADSPPQDFDEPILTDTHAVA